MQASNIFPLFRDGYGVGPVVAFQDCFGKCYRNFRYSVKVGATYKSNSSSRKEGTNGKGTDETNGRILAVADKHEINRLLRENGLVGRALHTGTWYEVHSD